jgi:hypothetical protein
MNGPRSTGPEYTGKHRRDSGPGVLPPAWRRAESDSRPGLTAASLPSRRPEPAFRPEPGQWPDAR